MMRWVTTDFVGSWSPIRMLPRRPLHDRIVEREIFLPFDFPSLFFFCNITLFARHFVWISLVRNNLLKGSNPAGQQQKSNKNLKLQQGDSLRLLHPSLSLSLSLSLSPTTQQAHTFFGCGSFASESTQQQQQQQRERRRRTQQKKDPITQ